MILETSENTDKYSHFVGKLYSCIPIFSNLHMSLIVNGEKNMDWTHVVMIT